MDSVYQTVAAERFQGITALQGAAWFNTVVLKFLILDFFQGSLLKSTFIFIYFYLFYLFHFFYFIYLFIYIAGHNASNKA